ncbi:hypothetical protein PTSG_04308 [Salpingoeca rosetta]|uniref:TNFR-Cys domain-containing protein n=1 Tax=Salpingoeca rosetta (strain ATCC 50818 / BSB-021) TaxID=946362 RepID=F2U864_SALR5|nr:uncharacterized protein PTSG_04308 [Salpingoeca rosetta]EGD72572.1 hypothetical protein PTSG_04308 [Salpingoeca rosetta]|eukprot:XP_004994395.1 hypothetical protein PTSG_04308 [Salpingoeca rosetta]
MHGGVHRDVRSSQSHEHQSGQTIPANPFPTATKELPFCANTSLSIGARLHDLIGRLSLQEKAGLIGPDPVTSPCAFLGDGVKRLDIPPYLYLVETNTAVAAACISQDKCATTFIGPTGSWRSLQPRVISTEMHAFNNLNWHRRGGVLQKIGLADPFLSGEDAAAYLAGCQNGPDRKYKKMAAGLRHIDAYSVETNRMAFNRNISTFDLWDTELQARALTAMCSYPNINGVPSPCANNMLLNDVVRRQWKRDMTLNGGADMELGEAYFTTNGYLEQAVKHNRTTSDTVNNNAVRRTSMSARSADSSLTSSNGRCISECPDDGEYELSNGCAKCHSTRCHQLPPVRRQTHQSRIADCPLNYYAKDHRCVPCTRCGMGTWASTPCSLSSDTVCSPWTEYKPGQKESVSDNAVRDRACVSCTLCVCEEPFIETIPPTLTTDRLCSCDTLTCNKLVTQLFEEMVRAEHTDEQLDVVLDVCSSDPGEDGIRDTIRQKARRPCPGCTDTCECSAGFILVYDADPADRRPCDSVTEFSPSIGGSKCELIEECERGQEEVSAPTCCSSDRVCHDCSAGTIDEDSDASPAAPAHDHHDSDPATVDEACRSVMQCDPDEEEIRYANPHASTTASAAKCVQDTCVPVSRCAASEYISTHGREQAPTLDSDSECTECSECPSGRFEIRACSALEDVQCAGCSACPPTTYILRACDSGDRCVVPAYCSAPCTAISDTECTTLGVCHQDQFELFPTATPTTDRICRDLTQCNPSTEYERTACATSSPSATLCEPCPIGTIDHDRNPLTACLPCPYGYYVPEGSSGSCEQFLCPAGTPDLDRNPSTRRVGVDFAALSGQRDCTPVPECDLGYEEVVRPTMRPTIFTDRQCHRCIEGWFCHHSNTDVCTRVSPCEPRSFETAAPTISTDRECQMGHTCPNNTTFISRLLTPTTQNHRHLLAYELVAPSLVNDRECQRVRSCQSTECERRSLKRSHPACVPAYSVSLDFDAKFNAHAGTQSGREAFEAALGSIIATVASLNEDLTARLFNRSVSGDITVMGFTASKCKADETTTAATIIAPVVIECCQYTPPSPPTSSSSSQHCCHHHEQRQQPRMAVLHLYLCVS